MRRCLICFLLIGLMLISGSYANQTIIAPKAAQQPTPALPKWQDQLQLTSKPDLEALISSNSGNILLASTDAGLTLIKNEAGRLSEATLLLADGPPLATALSADGDWVAVASRISIIIYRTSDGTAHSSFYWEKATKSALLQISGDGSNVCCLTDTELALYHGPKLNLRWSCPIAADERPERLFMSENGLTIAVIGKALQLYAPDAGTPLWQTKLTGAPQDIALSEDGVYLAIDQVDGEQRELLLFERWAAQPAWRFKHQGKSSCLRFSPDGRWLGLSADKFYLFSCPNDQPVLQAQQSGSLALYGEQVRMISDNSLHCLRLGQQTITQQLPELLPPDPTFIYSQEAWLFAVYANGLVVLIQLPPGQ